MFGPTLTRGFRPAGDDDHLLAEAKAAAQRSGTTLTAIIEDSLREKLARRAAPPAKRIKIPTVDGNAVFPGVDLDSNAALLDYMDGLT